MYEVAETEDVADAPQEIPENIFVIPSEELAEALIEIPEEMIPESEEFAEAPEIMPDEPAAVPDETDATEAYDAEIDEAPVEVPQEIQLPQEEIIEFTTEVFYETISLVEGQIEFTPPAEPIILEEKITVVSEQILDAPEFSPIYSGNLNPENLLENPEDQSGYEAFLYELGRHESGNVYSKVNTYGYLGRFQMGNLALQDVGLMDSNGNWTAYANQKYQIYSDDDFLNSKEAQDDAIKELLKRNWRTLKLKGAEEHIGEYARGIPITKSGLLAAAHLVGATGATDIFLNQERTDRYGTSMYTYLSDMAGYCLDSVIP